MKKLVLFFAVVVAVSFASCGQKAAEETTETVDTVAVVETIIDTTVVDTAAVIAE